MNDYERGFRAKCAQSNINPEQLMKLAQSAPANFDPRYFWGESHMPRWDTEEARAYFALPPEKRPDYVPPSDLVWDHTTGKAVPRSSLGTRSMPAKPPAVDQPEPKAAPLPAQAVNPSVGGAWANLQRRAQQNKLVRLQMARQLARRGHFKPSLTQIGPEPYDGTPVELPAAQQPSITLPGPGDKPVTHNAGPDVGGDRFNISQIARQAKPYQPQTPAVERGVFVAGKRYQPGMNLRTGQMPGKEMKYAEEYERGFAEKLAALDAVRKFLGIRRTPMFPNTGAKLRAMRQQLPGARWPKGMGVNVDPQGGLTVAPENLLAAR